MQFRQLLSTDSEERAVSPVIGVILMVAITVILAAVIASFVLGLGQNQDVAPQATFNFDYDSDAEEVTVSHTGGDSIRGDELYIRGSDEIASADQDSWDNLAPSSMSGEVQGESAVASGDSHAVDVSNDVADEYTVRVVWQSTTGDSSSELATDSGPDA